MKSGNEKQELLGSDNSTKNSTDVIVNAIGYIIEPPQTTLQGVLKPIARPAFAAVFVVTVLVGLFGVGYITAIIAGAICEESTSCWGSHDDHSHDTHFG